MPSNKNPIAPRADADTAGAKLQAFAEKVRNGIADYVADNMPDKKHSLEAIDLYIRGITIDAGMVTAAGASNERADAEKCFRCGHAAHSGSCVNVAPRADAEKDVALPDWRIAEGWHNTFSTSNPYCPCDLKSFTKAVRWAERAILAAKEKKS